jgi:hypothetical protein
MIIISIRNVFGSTLDREISYYDWFFREYHQSFQENPWTVSKLGERRFLPRTRT